VRESYEQLAMRTEAPITPELLQRLTPEARAVHAVIGLTTEVGELADIWKRRIFYGRDIDLVNAREEIGDVLWYLAILCDCLGTTLADEQARNIVKLRARYPEKFTEHNALCRDLPAEREVLADQCGPDQRQLEIGGEG
jgi:NTP pyrophosphatase (non-canonical NTP hydrolase)